MKKVRLFSILLILVMLLCGCGNKEEDSWSQIDRPEVETGGTPSESYRYSELPELYTPEQALKDGCLVLQWEEGEETPRVRGIDYWENFVKTTQAGEKITIRIVYFNSSRYWFTDLYYSHNHFTMYTRDIYSENQIGPFQYLTKIEGVNLNGGDFVSCYILTDDAELGSEQVLSLETICDIEAERKVSFHILDFTTYFE